MVPFVPPKFAQKPKVPNNEASGPLIHISLDHRLSERGSTRRDSQISHPSGNGKDKQFEYASDEDISALFRLSTSDHSLWLNADSRRTIQLSQGVCTFFFLL